MNLNLRLILYIWQNETAWTFFTRKLQRPNGRSSSPIKYGSQNSSASWPHSHLAYCYIMFSLIYGWLWLQNSKLQKTKIIQMGIFLRPWRYLEMHTRAKLKKFAVTVKIYLLVQQFYIWMCKRDLRFLCWKLSDFFIQNFIFPSVTERAPFWNPL